MEPWRLSLNVVYEVRFKSRKTSKMCNIIDFTEMFQKNFTFLRVYGIQYDKGKFLP